MKVIKFTYRSYLVTLPKDIRFLSTPIFIYNEIIVELKLNDKMSNQWMKSFTGSFYSILCSINEPFEYFISYLELKFNFCTTLKTF